MIEELNHPDLFVQVASDICRKAGKSMAEMVWHQHMEIGSLTARVAELESGLLATEEGRPFFDMDLAAAAFAHDMEPLWPKDGNE